MSSTTASTRKDRFTAFGVHYRPAHLSKSEFDARVEKLVDGYVATPAAQRGFLKVEIIFQTDLLDEHLQGLGFGAPRPCACVKIESESKEKCMETLNDPAVRNILASGKELGYPSEGTAFPVTPLVQADFAPHSDVDDSNVKLTVGIFPLPSSMDISRSPGHLEEFVGKSVMLPHAEKYLGRMRLTTLLPVDNTTSGMAKELGLASTEPVIVTLCEAKAWEDVIEMVQDPEVQGYVAEARRGFGFHPETSCFAGRTIVKLKRSV